MSVLNLSSDGLFNVLIVLVRALVRLGPKPKDDLLKACGVGLARVDAKQLNQTLNRWTELGLFQVEADNIVIAELHRVVLGKSADVAEFRLPKVVRKIVLAPENNARFWEDEENRSADLSRGLSWILAQDVYTIDTSSHKKIQLLEHDQIKDKDRSIIKNDTRWNGLCSWMTYLGFGRLGAQITIDPTDALRDALPEIFEKETTLEAGKFVSRAAAILPVLDGGSYRVEMEAVLNATNWPQPSDGQISTSLSRAIQRLESESLVAATQKSDSGDGIILLGSNSKPWREITHFRSLMLKKNNNA